KEAWLERRRERNHSWNPFAARYKTVSGYNLCFNLSTGWDVLWAPSLNAPFFVLEGENCSAGSQGTVVLCVRLASIAPSVYTLYCTDNFKLERAVKITLTPDRPVNPH